jgi:hypothetical protein
MPIAARTAEVVCIYIGVEIGVVYIYGIAKVIGGYSRTLYLRFNNTEQYKHQYKHQYQWYQNKYKLTQQKQSQKQIH